MFKRIVCFLSAVIVMTSSVFAWDAYSFTGVYDVASSAPVMILDDSSNGVYDLDFTSGVPTTGSLTLWASGESKVIPGYDPVPVSFPAGHVNNLVYSYHNQDDHYTYSTQSFDLSYSDGTFSDVTYDYYLWTEFTVTFTIPVPADSAAFECDFNFINFNVQQRLPVWGSDVGPSCDLYFDDTLIDTWFVTSGRVLTDSQFYSFSSSDPPQNIKFVIKAPPYQSSYGLPSDSSSSGTVSCWSYVYWRNDSTFKYSFLSPDGALIGNIDQAQDDINNHESMESQWTGSMSSNFDALDMDSFTFPSGLLSGFSLITDIFQDLWNGMGDYKILYVFPLFLGIALLLIGRISKFSGGQSSSRSNRGDDDA